MFVVAHPVPPGVWTLAAPLAQCLCVGMTLRRASRLSVRLRIVKEGEKTRVYLEGGSARMGGWLLPDCARRGIGGEPDRCTWILKACFSVSPAGHSGGGEHARRRFYNEVSAIFEISAKTGVLRFLEKRVSPLSGVFHTLP